MIQDFDFDWSSVFLTKSLPPGGDKSIRTVLPPFQCASDVFPFYPVKVPGLSEPLHCTPFSRQICEFPSSSILVPCLDVNLSLLSHPLTPLVWCFSIFFSVSSQNSFLRLLQYRRKENLRGCKLFAARTGCNISGYTQTPRSRGGRSLWLATYTTWCHQK